MTPPSSTPPEPLTAEDAAMSLVDLGWASSYEEARADLEAARADVEAEAAVGARGTDGVMVAAG